MITKKGFDEQLMISAFKKELTYGAGVTMSAANACSMRGYNATAKWEDEVDTDKDTTTGQEHGTEQDILMKRTAFSYEEPRLKPNSLALFAGLVMGDITVTQDALLPAYRHTIIPVPVGTAIPSVQLEHKKGGKQYAYKGIKGNSIKIGGESGKYLNGAVELIGGGDRATSATAFVPAITESFMKIGNCKVWMENGPAIVIAGARTQGTQDISSGAPVDLGARFKSFECTFNNNCERQDGSGGGDLSLDIDYGRRTMELSFTLLFNGQTEIDHFDQQNPLAIEFDVKGALIDPAGAMYYGGQIIIPRFKLKASPLPEGGVNDVLTCKLDCDVEDDGTNPVMIIEAYTAQPLYLAA